MNIVREIEIQSELAKEINSKSTDSQKSYSADAPLTDPEKDEFNRYPFAQRIAQTIINRKDSNSLVLALYGKWGEGKTTVLNYISGELNKKLDIVTITFNPWRFLSETELLSSFYFVLANNLGQSLPTMKEKIGKWVEEYLPSATALFDRADLAKEVGSLLSKVKLEELRDRIGNMLIEEGKLVVVLMDDIDRLEKAEIHAVFRLIKLSANLKNLVYILAFDDEVVSDALQERYGTSNLEAGRNFLEKIVQVPIDLPSIEPQRLRDFCFSAIDTILNHCEIQLSDNEVQQFVMGFSSGIEIRLKTPRMAVRYANILLFSLPLVKGEVNIVDFLLIEAIRVFYPSAYEVISNNKDAFIGKGLIDFAGSQTDKKNFRYTIDQIFIDLEQKETEALRSLLASLFPRIQTIYGNTHYGSEWDVDWSKEKRVAADNYFNKYFLYSVPSGDVSDRDIDELLTNIENASVEELMEHISTLLSSQNAKNLIYKLNLVVERFSPEGSIKFAIILSSLGNRFPNPQQVFSFNTPFARAAMLIARLIGNLNTEEEKEKLAEKIMEVGQPISFSAEIIRWLKTDQSRYPNSITENDWKKLAEILTERISEQVSGGLSVFDEFPENAPWLLTLWSKYKSRDEVNQFLKMYIDKDQANIYKVLDCFVPTSYPMMGDSLPHKSNFERDQYNNIANIFDPSIIYSNLVKIYGNDLNSEEYPRSTEDPTIRIASQFMWLHKFVQAEMKEGN